jgi:hypothetical protein
VLAKEREELTERRDGLVREMPLRCMGSKGGEEVVGVEGNKLRRSPGEVGKGKMEIGYVESSLQVQKKNALRRLIN